MGGRGRELALLPFLPLPEPLPRRERERSPGTSAELEAAAAETAARPRVSAGSAGGTTGRDFLRTRLLGLVAAADVGLIGGDDEDEARGGELRASRGHAGKKGELCERGRRVRFSLADDLNV